MSRLSQAISEGDGISILVEVGDAESAEAAARQGADGLVADHAAGSVREASELPLLHLGSPESASGTADAVVVPVEPERWDEAQALGLECVVRVTDADGLENALDELDPEIFLLSAEPGSEDDPLEALLALLHDVPAGKLAIADLRDASADDVAELERAGVDAVLVSAGAVAALVPAEPPEV